MNYKSIVSKSLLVALVCSLAACSDDESVTKVEEGLPASLSFSISLPATDEVLSTRASATAESSVEDVTLLFYKDENTVPVPVTVGDLKASSGEDDSYREYNVTIPETSGLTSGEWYVYGVANTTKQYVSLNGKDITKMTKAEIDDFCTSGSHDLDFVETGVLLSGKYRDYTKGDVGKLTLQPGANSLDEQPLIVLKRTVAKNVFEFTNGSNSTTNNVKFTPTSFKVVNHCASAPLMESSDWTTIPSSTGKVDATKKKIGDPGDKVSHHDNRGSDVFATSAEAPISGTSFTFYCQENVQKSTNWPSSGTDYNTREVHKSSSDQSFQYAPENATYVVVKGNYEDSEYKGTVTYTIHLGDFSSANDYDFSNFTVRRNVKYTYKVTVNGVNNIVTEVTTEGDEPQPGAEGDLVTPSNENVLTLDAHYEQVLIDLGTVKSFQNISDMAVHVKTPYTSGKFESTTSDWGDADIDWIEFGKPNVSSTTRKQFYAYSHYFNNSTKITGDNEEGLCNVKVLMSELKNLSSWASSSSNSNYPHLAFASSASGRNVTASNTHVYVAAYVNEYFYDDKVADRAKWINADNREMTLGQKVQISADGQSSLTSDIVFSLSQQSIKCPFSLTALTNPFGLETTEETPRKTLSSMGSEGNVNSGVTNALSGTDNFDGWSNTTSAKTSSYGNSNTIIGKRWNNLVNVDYNGYIDGKLGGTSGNDALMQDSYDYTLYHFLTRNRDLDGDGIIDAEEIRWYVPAEQQCVELWYGMNSLPTASQIDLTAKTYISSTAGPARTWWANEGVSFGYWKTTDLYGLNSVRVIRNLGAGNDAYKSKSSDVYTYDASTRTVTIVGLSEASLRNSSMAGNYDQHKLQESPDKLPKKFQIASGVYNNSTTYASSEIATSTELGTDYYEATDQSDKGQWRIPNEKEFGMIFQLIKANSYTGVTLQGKYVGSLGCRTTTGVSGNNYYKMLDTHITTAGDVEENDEGNNVECTQLLLLVRDVTTSSAKARKASAVKVKKH